MQIVRTLLPLAAIAVVFAGCAPSITVENRTPFDVRVIVNTPAGDETVAPTSGNNSEVAALEGRYNVTAFLDEEWIAWAKASRKGLNDSLADSSHLSGPQLLNVVQRLKDIAGRMQAYESTAGPPTGETPREWVRRTWCSGEIPKDSDGATVTITTRYDRLVATCTTLRASKSS